MCGRYALAYPPRDVRQRLIQDGLPVDEEPLDEDIRPGYNIAPGHIEPVYRAIPAENRGGEGEGDRLRYVLEPMKWGLIPSWTKRPPPSSALKTINCRSESLLENTGLWTSMKQSKRCIIPAQGFYEWLKKGTDKIPHHIKSPDDHLLYFAGLYDYVQYENEEKQVYTYTIITVPASPALRFLHDRMPAVLSTPEDVQAWLAPNTRWNTQLMGLLKPYGGELDVYAVDKAVGNVKNDDARFVVPIDSKENKGNIKNFFTSKKREKGEGTAQKGIKEEVETAPTLKRERDEVGTMPTDTAPPIKAVKLEDTTSTTTPHIRSAISNVSNRKPSPAKKKDLKDGTPRITNFFTK